MPTIDELPPAVSVSDTDEIMVSQTDIARKATRAQILSGVQPALALPQNSLLGRVSAGTGGPEIISLGANLPVTNGTIDAPAPFLVTALPVAGPPSPTDLVAIAQGGENAAANYAAFMGGLSVLSDISGSNLLVAPSGGVGNRLISDMLADAISIESFGAVGDGVTDNTAAFAAAAQSGRPLRLDARIYIMNGPLPIGAPIALLGVPGATVVRRLEIFSQQPWIEAAGASIYVSGIIFDENNLLASNSPAFQVDSSCISANFSDCQFLNASGASAGNGLLITCGIAAEHQLLDCQFLNNGANGIVVTGAGTVTLRNCVAQNNKAAGISVAPESASWLRGNSCNMNNIGISVGSWQSAANNSNTPVACFVEGNDCFDNTTWGIAVSGSSASISNNISMFNGTNTAGGGIVARLCVSRLTGNQVSGGFAGIDARTSWSSLIASNQVANAATGILLGGCENVSVSANFLTGNQWAIDVPAIEPSLSFNLSGPISIIENWIGFSAAQGGGIFVHDGCVGTSVVRNDFNGWGSATIGQAMWLHTDQAVVGGNSWNNQPVMSIQSSTVGGQSALVVPDIADEVLVLNVGSEIDSLLTDHQADTLGQIGFIRVMAGGSGYTSAEIEVAGSGDGAAAIAVVNQGQVIWIIVTNPGSGYGLLGNGATIIITGNGSGAAATAYVGLPVLGGRRLRLNCNCMVQLALNGTSPSQQNWTDFAITIPALGAAEIEGVFGAWRAVSFPAIDYLAPTGNGGAVLQSVGGGDVTLRPSAGGALQIASAAEPAGCTSTVGRGAPTGSIVAPPGSDFRNLNGGPGNTFWIKQTGTDATGWLAIA